MSINLGTPGCDACAQLRNNENWALVCESVKEQTTVWMNNVLDSDVGKAEYVRGYAKAVRDLYIAFDAATKGQRQSQSVKIGPMSKTLAQKGMEGITNA